MKQRLPNLLMALSLLPCVAVVGLWVRTYQASDWISHSMLTGDRNFTEITEWSADTPRGVVRLTWRQSRLRQSPEGLDDLYGGWRLETREPIGLTPDSSQPVPLIDRLGFDWAAAQYGGVGGGSITIRTVTFPLWAIMALFALLPSALFCHRVRRLRRVRARLCPSCGYDLRATPDRCPECGER